MSTTVDWNYRVAPIGVFMKQTNGLIKVNELIINILARYVTFRNKRVMLTNLEFDLLTYLAQHSERVCLYEELLDEIWGYKDQQYPYIVQLAACRLRKKLRNVGMKNNSLIRTVRGIGLHFDQYD